MQFQQYGVRETETDVNITAYYALCYQDQTLYRELVEVAALSRRLRNMIYNVEKSCPATDFDDITVSLSWLQGATTHLVSTSDCGTMRHLWEQAWHSHVCSDLTTASLALDFVLAFGIPCYLLAMWIIHRHARSLKAWRFNVESGSVGADLPVWCRIENCW